MSEIETIEVPAAEAVNTLRHLHKIAPKRHAFVIGSDQAKANLLYSLNDSHKAKEIIANADLLSIDAWLSNQRTREIKAFEALGYDIDKIARLQLGVWPETVPDAHDSFLSSHYRSIDGHVVIGLSPAPLKNWWETYAYLNFGGWTGCPEPEVHVMLGKFWAKKYGAVLTFLNEEGVEFSIAKPLHNKADAIQMAILHNHYSSETVHPHRTTANAYAAKLLNASTWQFSWG